MIILQAWVHCPERARNYRSASDNRCGSRISFRWQFPNMDFDQMVMQGGSKSDKRSYSTSHGKRKSYSMHWIMVNGQMTPTQ
jgi:hypothetical protein